MIELLNFTNRRNLESHVINNTFNNFLFSSTATYLPLQILKEKLTSSKDSLKWDITLSYLSWQGLPSTSHYYS